MAVANQGAEIARPKLEVIYTVYTFHFTPESTFKSAEEKLETKRGKKGGVNV